MKTVELEVEYTLWVKIIRREGYRTTTEAERTSTIELPIGAAGACDLNAVAAAMLDDCNAEIIENETAPETEA